MGYLDLLRAMHYWFDICPATAVSIVMPDQVEARLVWGSVSALPVNRPCTTSSHYTGPHATHGVYIYLLASPGQRGYLGHIVYACIGSGVKLQ